MSDRLILSDDQVADLARLTPATSLGVRARQLAREVEASRKLIADLRALHRGDPMDDRACRACYFTVPCPTIRLIDAAELSS